MYNYETIRDELKKNKYVIYIVDNNKFEFAFKFSGKKSELKDKITKKYLKKNKPEMFFVCFKLSFHTGTKPQQGGPLAINLSTFIFVDNELVNGFTYNEKYRRFAHPVWFQRKYLEKNGWNEKNYEIIISKLVVGKVKLSPLGINLFNVKFMV